MEEEIPIGSGHYYSRPGIFLIQAGCLMGTALILAELFVSEVSVEVSTLWWKLKQKVS